MASFPLCFRRLIFLFGWIKSLIFKKCFFRKFDDLLRFKNSLAFRFNVFKYFCFFFGTIYLRYFFWDEVIGKGFLLKSNEFYSMVFGRYSLDTAFLLYNSWYLLAADLARSSNVLFFQPTISTFPIALWIFFNAFKDRFDSGWFFPKY